jgi:hypothetical protein
MRHSCILLAGGFLALLTLGGAAPWRSLPSCVIGRFEGITPTDGVGTVIGTPDPGDWGCLGGAARGPADVPIPPPTQVCLGPAYPNPATASVSVGYSLPMSSQVSLTVYGQTRKHGPHGAFLVRTLADGTYQAGSFMVLWDGNDDQGMRVPPGLYRVVLTVVQGSICGDVEIR